MIPAAVPPSDDPTPSITDLLLAWRNGSDVAARSLFPAVYAELRRRAARAMRQESPAHTLQPTALVHETYLRLCGQQRAEWRDRAHFFGIAAQMMRRILVDHARGRLAGKRGGGADRLSTADIDVADGSAEAATDVDLLALHDALGRLALLDPAQERLVEMRYFSGMTIEETAEAMGISPATVKREWAIARAWLRRELGD